MASNPQDLRSDPYRLAIVAAERLRDALSTHDIAIPSLRGGHHARDIPFVELGGCTVDVAEALSAVLEKVRP